MQELLKKNTIHFLKTNWKPETILSIEMFYIFILI